MDDLPRITWKQMFLMIGLVVFFLLAVNLWRAYGEEPVPEPATYKFIGFCVRMENGQPQRNPCVVFTVAGEPDTEYLAEYDDEGTVQEITRHNNRSGKTERVWKRDQ